MKYIKLIKEFVESKYTKIAATQFGKSMESEEITTSDIDFIRNNIKKSVDFCRLKIPYENLIQGERPEKNCIEVVIRKRTKQYESDGPLINFGIYKFKDEWFFVSWNNNYWKCDQIDGLISCIEDCVIGDKPF